MAGPRLSLDLGSRSAPAVSSNPHMKVVIAPQGFKGGISGLEAARAIARGVLAAVPDAETVLVPVADGGDGTLHALVDATGGQIFTSTVTGPINQQVEAQWGVMGDGRTAVIEMARASGLAIVPPRRRNPKVTTTLGTGQILKETLERGYRRVIVGLGGSATNDGGAGMATALGAKFLDSAGNALPPGGAALARLHRVDTSGLLDQIAGAEIIAATDVTNPLCGPTGASAVYGPQKGASEEVVAQLDAALLKFAQVVKRDTGRDVLNTPGAGARRRTGGWSDGLRWGPDTVGHRHGLPSTGLRLPPGRGRPGHNRRGPRRPVHGLRQSPRWVVARHASAHGVPTVLLAGSLGEGHEELYQHGVVAILCISRRLHDLREGPQPDRRDVGGDGGNGRCGCSCWETEPPPSPPFPKGGWGDLDYPLSGELHNLLGKFDGTLRVNTVKGLGAGAAGQVFRVPGDVVVLVQLPGFGLNRIEHHVEELGVFAQVQQRVAPNVLNPLVVQVGLDGLFRPPAVP